ncbi:Hypothetical predicted protein [Cloeon dipterum]|uniref:Uncharacterized protein n=1 Tax=Cloeon dipterum TaxID=197152 RepID=A0A8S1CJ93_9INSE|nr:Hypothetical predicted protein [Cloeon dipterum]
MVGKERGELNWRQKRTLRILDRLHHSRDEGFASARDEVTCFGYASWTRQFTEADFTFCMFAFAGTERASW